jgi:hypothetical protein
VRFGTGVSTRQPLRHFSPRIRRLELEGNLSDPQRATPVASRWLPLQLEEVVHPLQCLVQRLLKGAAAWSPSDETQRVP